MAELSKELATNEKRSGKTLRDKSQIPQEIDMQTGEALPYFRHPMSRIDVTVRMHNKGRTQQSHAESCDVNTIIRQFDRTGLLPPATKQPQYGDVSALNKPLTELINDQRDIEARYKNDLAANAAAQAAAKQQEEEARKNPPPSSTPPAATPPKED